MLCTHHEDYMLCTHHEVYMLCTHHEVYMLCTHHDDREVASQAFRRGIAQCVVMLQASRDDDHLSTVGNENTLVKNAVR